MRNSFRLLSTGIVLAVLGVILTVFVAGDMIDNAQKPADYNTLEMGDYKAGMIVEGDLPYNYGNYESVTKEGSNTSIGDYYMIEAGSEGFMGIYTAKKDLMKELKNQYNEFKNAETEDEIAAVRTVHFRGKVEKMDDEDVKWFRRYLKEAGLTDEIIDECTIELYIRVKDGAPVWLLPIGIVVTLAGAFLVFLFIRRKMMGA